MKRTRDREPMSTFTKVILCALGVSLLLGALLGFLTTRGLMLIYMRVHVWILIAPIAILGAWGIYAVTRKIMKDRFRIVVGCLLAFALLAILTTVNTMLPYVAPYYSFNKFAEKASPSGKRVVILEGVGFFSGEEGEETDSDVGDVAYLYVAFPKKMLLFADTNADVEGVIRKGPESQAQMRIEWLDDDTARLYLEDAEEKDSGEIVVRLAE